MKNEKRRAAQEEVITAQGHCNSQHMCVLLYAAVRRTRSTQERNRNQEVHLVNRLELLRHGKDGLNVVVAQFLHQVSDGRIILGKTGVDFRTEQKPRRSSSRSHRLLT